MRFSLGAKSNAENVNKLPDFSGIFRKIQPPGNWTFRHTPLSCGLRILNGRMLGDSLGQYTSYQPSGSSVIDYFIASEAPSESILNVILCFSVHNLQADLSDHCQISLQLQSHISAYDVREEINPLPTKYIWNDDSPVMFQQALNSLEIKNKIKKNYEERF